MSKPGANYVYEPPAAHRVYCTYRESNGAFACGCSRIPYCSTCHQRTRHKFQPKNPAYSYECVTVSKCQLCSGTYRCGETCDCSTPEGIIKRIKYKNLQIVIKPENGIGDKYLQVRGPDDYPRSPVGGWTGRKWRLSRHMTKGEIVQTAFMACLAWEEHECREAFKYKGQPVMSPHYNIESLVRLCEQGQFEERS